LRAGQGGEGKLVQVCQQRNVNALRGQPGRGQGVVHEHLRVLEVAANDLHCALKARQLCAPAVRGAIVQQQKVVHALPDVVAQPLAQATGLVLKLRQHGKGASEVRQRARLIQRPCSQGSQRALQ
jgi:hypothetical protein